MSLIITNKNCAIMLYHLPFKGDKEEYQQKNYNIIYYLVLIEGL